MPGLDFLPQQKTSRLMPICIWKGWQLNHFEINQEAETFLTQDVSYLPLHEALLQIYPQLGFAELGRLYALLQKNDLLGHFQDIVPQYGYGYDQRLIEAFEIYLKLTPSVQQWIESHQFSPRDVLPLAALENLPHTALEALAAADISRSYGAQILELLVDNLLLEHSLDELTPKEPLTQKTVPQWIEQLKILRFPQTARLDESKKDKLTGLPWTKEFQTRWHRQGDQSGLEVRFSFSTKKELENKIQSLERVLENYDD